MRTAGLPIDGFCAELEAPIPSPAGGSAAAAVAAIAASLVVMIGRGSPRWGEGAAAAAAAAAVRDRLLGLGADDVEAVATMLAASRAHASTVTEAGSGLEAARLQAARVPLAIAEHAAEVAHLAREATRHGSRVMQADAAAAAALAATAARVAAGIADLNLSAFAAGEEPPQVAGLRRASAAVSDRLAAGPGTPGPGGAAA